MSDILLVEEAAPATPGANQVVLYPKADGLLYSKDDVGTETRVSALPATIGTNGQSLQADSSKPSGLVYIDNPARPNLLINPNWLLDQINEGTLYTINTTVSGPDGWTGSATGAGVFKIRTLADPDNAALKCLEITCTTSDASIAAGDRYIVYTTIEGYDITSLMAGTSSAQAITVQFKFKTSVTGVYGVSIKNSAINRSYIGTITVADTNEAEYSVTLTMDTTGTWLYTNGVGIYLVLSLASGSTYQSAAGSWQAGNFDTTSSQANFMSSNTNIAYLKRIQLIPGALVQAYCPADFQKELAKAQRYYFKTFNQGTAVAQNVGANTGHFVYAAIQAGAATDVGPFFPYPVAQRISNGTVTFYNPAAANGQVRDLANSVDCTGTALLQQGTSGLSYYCTGNAGTTVNAQLGVHATVNARLS